MFSLVNKNKFGNVCVTPALNLEDFVNDKFWSIQHPGPLSVDGAVRRTYGGVEYLLSPTAAAICGEEGSGGGINVVVRVVWPDIGEFFILLADNKKYWMPAGRESLPDERAKDTALRTLKEELQISGIDEERLKSMGTFSYQFTNGLLPNVGWAKVTEVFFVDLAPEEAQHLIPRGEQLTKEETSPSIFQASEYDFELDGQEMVMFVKADDILNLPHVICGKNFDGHHRKTIYIASDQSDSAISNIDTSYLHTYDVAKKA